ncbi:MAG: argininosuccinate lyase [Desulfobacterales bacterium]
MAEKLWKGRFGEKTAPVVERFTSSIAFDRRLFRYDIEGSIAHCRLLARAGILTPEEEDALIEGLNQVRREIENGTLAFDDTLEDIHTHVEARLTELVGKASQKIHTGRSRNDQVALDLRLYLRDVVDETVRRLEDLQRVLVRLAREHFEVLLPGYTHLQRAQPVRLAHHFLAYVEMFARDVERMRSCRGRVNVLPLGAAALAGTAYPLDRAHAAALLGFEGVSANSLDAVSDRDFVIEFLAAASICMMHLSRFSEELVLWSSSEFQFIELPDAFATGSSIMPQKKNPDVPELVRGKTGRVYGHLFAQLTMMKGLPLSYNRDLQEDKPALFDAADTLLSCLEVFGQMLPGLRVRRDRMEAALRTGYLNATEMADYLVRKGLPFREAHHVTGEAVRLAIEKGCELNELPLPELRRFSKLIEEDLYACLEPLSAVERRAVSGGTAGAAVRAALEAAEKRLGTAPGGGG